MAGKTRIGPLARVAEYAKNLGKEAGDFGRAWSRANQLSNEVGPGTDTAAERARKQQDAEFGQLVGALIQGRRYDKKGRQR
jgi:hypothetical protein